MCSLTIRVFTCQLMLHVSCYLFNVYITDVKSLLVSSYVYFFILNPLSENPSNVTADIYIFFPSDIVFKMFLLLFVVDVMSS